MDNGGGLPEGMGVTGLKEGKGDTPRHIIIQMPVVKDKERTLKVAREKLVTHRGVPIRL